MTADLNEHSAIGTDPQVSAYVPGHSHHKGLHVVMWILLLLIMAVPLMLVLHHREEAKESAAAKHVTPGDHHHQCDGQKG